MTHSQVDYRYGMLGRKYTYLIVTCIFSLFVGMMTLIFALTFMFNGKIKVHAHCENIRDVLRIGQIIDAWTWGLLLCTALVSRCVLSSDATVKNIRKYITLVIVRFCFSIGPFTTSVFVFNMFAKIDKSCATEWSESYPHVWHLLIIRYIMFWVYVISYVYTGIDILLLFVNVNITFKKWHNDTIANNDQQSETENSTVGILGVE